MPKVVASKRVWKLCLSLGLVISALAFAVFIGCASDAETPILSPPTATPSATTSSNFKLPSGPDWPLESRILRSEVIARVKLRSVAQVVERNTLWKDIYGKDYYVAALEFTFDVLEYLKGSGGSQLKVIAEDDDEWFETEAEASTKGPDLLSTRITRWDDREAIVFVRKLSFFSSLKQADRYWLSYARVGGGEEYTIANSSWRVWLPDAATPVSANGSSSGQSTSSGSGGQRFLLEEPPDSSASGSASGSSQGNQNTVTLSDLKALIARLESEVKTGFASKEYVVKYNLGDYKYTAGDYAWCLSGKYYDIHNASRIRRTDGKHIRYYSTNLTMSSGSPAGTKVYQDEEFANLVGDTDSSDYFMVDWLGGTDANLFTVVYPMRVQTTRPLPAGNYKFFYNPFPFGSAICDALTKEEKERAEYFLTVTAPMGTVHEAFFDPASTSLGLGFQGSQGSLSPASFTYGRSTVAITRITWSSIGFLTMILSPSVSLSGKHVEFIKTDGTLAAKLSIDRGDLSGGGGIGVSSEENPEAAAAQAQAQAAGAKFLFWLVPSAPWKAGDKLMIRIR